MRVENATTSMNSLLWSLQSSSIVSRSTNVHSILSIKYFIVAFIRENNPRRSGRCFEPIWGLLGAIYETKLYSRRIRLPVEEIIDKLDFVLIYRTRSGKESISSRSWWSLMISRSVTFCARPPAPGSVTTVWNWSSFYSFRRCKDEKSMRIKISAVGMHQSQLELIELKLVGIRRDW